MYIKNSMSRNRMLSIIKKAGIIGIWLVIWQIASSVTGLAFLLPGPVTVFLAPPVDKPGVFVYTRCIRCVNTV